jgi:hypothetical protein
MLDTGAVTTGRMVILAGRPMKKLAYTEVQISYALQQAEAGTTVGAVR